MPDVRALMESAQARGLRLFLAEGKVKVKAPHSLDGDTQAFIEELREHKEEIKAVLVAPPCWNCGAKVAETIDIHGRRWWKCWECAATV